MTTLAELKYRAARRTLSEMSTTEVAKYVDDELNKLRVPPYLRDEIVDRILHPSYPTLKTK